MNQWGRIRQVYVCWCWGGVYKNVFIFAPLMLGGEGGILSIITLYFTVKMVDVCVRDHFEERTFSLQQNPLKSQSSPPIFFFFFKKRTLYIINQYNFKCSHYFGKKKKLLVGRIDKIFTLMTKTIDYLKKKKKI